MKAVYLFNDGGSTRIPVTDYEFDKYFHSLVTVKGGGYYNKNNREYVFNRKVDAEKLSRLLPDTPVIQIGNEFEEPEKVLNFFERVWVEGDSEEKNYFSYSWKNKLEVELHSRKYSQNTIDLYLYYNSSLCKWLKKTPDTITLDDVKNYLAYREVYDKQASSSLNIALSAIKFFFKHILKNDIIREQKRPRQDKRLPIVLAKRDIKLILDLEQNLKHKLLLMIVYSSGLRVGEVVKLKKKDIDVSRKSIIIIEGKGRKDRYTITSEKALKTLNEYLIEYDITDWLFPGQKKGRHLSIRTAQYIYDNAVKRARIIKSSSIHSLRHSFATHLLESGIDITYIKDLLGHSSIRTTERYTHVAKRKALSIASPLDTIDDDDEPEITSPL